MTSPSQATALPASGNTSWYSHYSFLHQCALAVVALGLSNGVLPDSVIPASIARDTEVSSAVTAAIADLRGAAPQALDTLIEIANQLASDESVVAALTTTVGGKLAKTANLADLPDKAAARTSLGLGPFATGTDAANLTGTLSDGVIPPGITRDTELSSAVTAAIADLRGAAPTALDTLVEIADRLATDQTALSSLLASVGQKADATALSAHTTATNNPHATTKAQVGLGNVDDAAQLAKASNLADLPDKPTARTNLGLGALAIKTPTGTPDGTKFLRDDNTYAVPPSGAAGAAKLTAAGPYTSASHTPVSGEYVIYNPSAAIAPSLPVAAADQRFGMANVGTATVTLNRQGSDAFADGSTSVVLAPGDRAVVLGAAGGLFTFESRYLSKRTAVSVDGTPQDTLAIDSSAVGVADISGLTAALAGKLAGLAITVQNANYTASAGDFVAVDSTNLSPTITLPTAPADKTLVAVKHVIKPGTNTVTVARGGSTDAFNRSGGPTSITLPMLSQGALLFYTGGVWYVIADDLPLSQLDLRYPVLAANPGTPSGSNFLAGDGTYKTPAGGASDAWLGVAVTHVEPMQAVTLGANRTHYLRVTRGSVTASKIGLFVAGAPAGNIAVAVYRSTGSGLAAAPSSRVAVSATVACPAAGYAEIALDSAVAVAPGDWLAISTDGSTILAGGATSAVGDAMAVIARYTTTGAPTPPASPTNTYGYNRALFLTAVA